MKNVCAKNTFAQRQGIEEGKEQVHFSIIMHHSKWASLISYFFSMCTVFSFSVNQSGTIEPLFSLGHFLTQ